MDHLPVSTAVLVILITLKLFRRRSQEVTKKQIPYQRQTEIGVYTAAI